MWPRAIVPLYAQREPRVLDTERKSLEAKLSAETPGQFRAVFSTLNVVDHDGDITVPGALKHGTEVIVGAYGHDSRSLPTGKGVIGGDESSVWVDGEFFLDTPQGEATYKTLKRLQERQEWSYTYRVLASDEERRDGKSVRILKDIQVFSVDPVMVGAGIGTHTAGIKSAETFVTEAEHALASVQVLIDRSKSLADLRAKEGRALSAANRSKLAALLEASRLAVADLEQLLSDGDPEKERADLERAFGDFLAVSARLAGVAVGDER